MLKYFEEIIARKDWTCSGCESDINQGKTYFRCKKEILCLACKEEIEEQMRVIGDEWWAGLWTFAEEHITGYAETYGRSSDYEQIMMDDYATQHPGPNTVFIAKKRE